jgi:hypothetical protein
MYSPNVILFQSVVTASMYFGIVINHTIEGVLQFLVLILHTCFINYLAIDRLISCDTIILVAGAHKE